MKTWMKFLLPVALLALLAVLPGCFSSPTNPHESAFGSVGQGDGNYGGGTGSVPTPTPTARHATPTPGTGGGTGSITGTISGAPSGIVTIYASGAGGFRSTYITGTGTYTLSNCADGTYTVTATDTALTTRTYSGSVVITGGNTVSNVNFTF